MTDSNPASCAGTIDVEVNALVPKLEIEKLWQQLEARANPSFFLSSTWIGTLLSTNGFAPILLAARLRDRVVGLALVSPGKNGRFGLTWPSLSLNETGIAKHDCVMIEDNGFLSESGLEMRVAEACMRFIFVHMTEWKELRLSGVPDSLLQVAMDSAMPIARDHARPSPFIDITSGEDEGLAGLSSNTRQQIRRSLRLYRQRGEITLTPSTDLSEARDRFVELEKLHQVRWFERGRAGAFAQPFFKRFHDALLTRGFPLGQVDVLRMAVGQQTIGLLYTFFYNNEAYAYQTGFRYEDDQKLKPGLTSHILALNYCRERGVRRYRLLAGDSRYKRSLATGAYPLHWLSIRRPHAAFYLETIARGLTGRRP